MAELQYLDADEVTRRLPFPALIEALAEAFTHPIEAPPRLHGDLGSNPDRPEQRDLLVMPAWVPGAEAGVKLVTLFAHNDRRDRPRIQGLYVLFHPEHGTPLAVLDAAALTTRRTAAASALAARYLARPDATHLLVCGSGRLAHALPRAYAAVRALTHVTVWARRPEAARATAADLRFALPGVEVHEAEDLGAAVGAADMVTTAIPSAEPFLQGAWLRPGTHLDLIGSYRPTMREADHEALQRAALFVDTRAGVLAEAGEFIDALAAGVIAEADLLADLPDLVTGRHPGRTRDDEITLFKSVGTALEDLAGARLALRTLGSE
ncbi:MAG: ornithine cyclodeaminase family protein [Tepidisphaera sp.]|nr:ornithine cyclodeaminase family protein [Tepidisphaera sp.]